MKHANVKKRHPLPYPDNLPRNNMKIKNILLYRHNRPFNFCFASQHTQRKTSESIILKLTFDNGVTGFGESSPRSYVTREDQVSVIHTIRHCFFPLIANMEIRSVCDIDQVLKKMELECRRKNIMHFNSALGAVDLALLDALGKYQKQPVSRYLGDEIRKDIAYSISIPIMPLEMIKKLFPLIKKHRFNTFKIILGPDEAHNLERVKLIRALSGDEADLRVEANGKLTSGQVLSNLGKMENYNLSAIEQPVAVNNINGLKKIKEKIKLSVIVDESICSIEDAQNLITHEACDILNIKISKCGGLLRSRKIVDYAKSRNIQCQMGAHVGETDILHSAGRHFAATTPDLVYIEGMSSLLFEELLCANPLTHTRKEKKAPRRDSGLGISEKNQAAILEHCIAVN